jgi:adenylate cyclase
MTRLVEELKRRRVVQVALVYLAAAFVVLQVADILVPALHLPAWTVTLIVVLLALGFIVAIMLSWVVDLTPDGVVTTPPRGAPERPGQPVQLSRRMVLMAGIGVVGLVLAGAALALRSGASAAVSVAVLPFADMSDDRSQEYFGDGIAEELLNTLRAAGVDVASRTSSFAFKGRALSARQIAHELGVGHVIDGSVRKADNRLRISAQLVDVRTDRTLWSESFDRSAGDVFAVQDEIARAVADALRVRLGSAAGAQGTTDTRAYDLYLLGLYHWHQRTPDALLRALDYFTAARDADPTFARAWAGIAFTYHVMPDYTGHSVVNARRLLRHSAERAVALDPSSAEARTALGAARDRYDHVAAALAELDRAIALDPGFATAWHWRGNILIGEGRLQEAEATLRTAHRLDPAAPALHGALVVMLDVLGRQEEALHEAETILARVPRFRSMLNMSFVLGAQLGRAREFEPRLRDFLDVIGEDPAHAATIVAGIERPQDRAAAIALLDEILQRQAEGPHRFYLTGLFALLGAREQTLRLLETEPDWHLVVRRSFFGFVHDEPRYQAVLAQRRQPLEEAP